MLAFVNSSNSSSGSVSKRAQARSVLVSSRIGVDGGVIVAGEERLTEFLGQDGGVDEPRVRRSIPSASTSTLEIAWSRNARNSPQQRRGSPRACARCPRRRCRPRYRRCRYHPSRRRRSPRCRRLHRRCSRSHGSRCLGGAREGRRRGCSCTPVRVRC